MSEKLLDFGTYAIMANAVMYGVRIYCYPNNLDVNIMYKITAEMLAAWPSVKIDNFGNTMFVQVTLGLEQAATFGFAGAGVYVTCTEGVYRLHRVDPQ